MMRMTKQLYVLPMQTEEIKGLVEKEGNIKNAFLNLVYLFSNNYQVKNPQMSKRDCINHATKIAEKQFEQLGLKRPL